MNDWELNKHCYDMFISGENGEPYAIQTDLGWSIVGGVDPHKDGDAIGVTHRIITREVQADLQPRYDDGSHRNTVQFVTHSKVKEVIIPSTKILKILESDFKDTAREDKTMSHEDVVFLNKISGGIH